MQRFLKRFSSQPHQTSSRPHRAGLWCLMSLIGLAGLFCFSSSWAQRKRPSPYWAQSANPNGSYRAWGRRVRQRRAKMDALPYQPNYPRATRRNPRVHCSLMLKRTTALGFLRKGRTLEDSIRAYIAELRRCKMLEPFDKTRLVIYDHRGCKLVAINQHSPTSAASLIKTYVMLASYYKAQQQGIPPSKFPMSLQRHINLMMRVSNNHSTNYLLRNYLGRNSPERGMKYVNQLLRKYGIRQTRVVELIPKKGRTYRNWTTAQNLSKLFYNISQGRYVSKAYADKMMRVMIKSRDTRTKTNYLRSKYRISAATKTGYTKRTNGVSGVIVGGRGLGRRKYNFVSILTRPLVNANEWVWRKYSKLSIQRFSEMTYQHYARGEADRELRSHRRYRRWYCSR